MVGTGRCALAAFTGSNVRPRRGRQLMLCQAMVHSSGRPCVWSCVPCCPQTPQTAWSVPTTQRQNQHPGWMMHASAASATPPRQPCNCFVFFRRTHCCTACTSAGEGTAAQCGRCTPGSSAAGRSSCCSAQLESQAPHCSSLLPAPVTAGLAYSQAARTASQPLLPPALLVLLLQPWQRGWPFSTGHTNDRLLSRRNVLQLDPVKLASPPALLLVLLLPCSMPSRQHRPAGMHNTGNLAGWWVQRAQISTSISSLLHASWQAWTWKL